MRVSGSAKITATRWRKLFQAAGPAAMASMVYGMGVEAERIIDIARPRAPVLTGRLRQSGWVGRPRERGYYMKAGTRAGVQQYWLSRQATVRFGFGADDAVGSLAATRKYARRQHENMTYRHPRGGGPKYLERTLQEAQAGLIPRSSPAVLTMWRKLTEEAMQ